MQRHPVNKPSEQGTLSRAVPFLAIVALLVAAYLVLFHSGFGAIPSARAQVDPVQIGGAIAETIIEEGARTSLDEAGAELMDEEAGAEPELFQPEELPRGESAEPAVEEDEDGWVVFSPEYINDEGVGGPLIYKIEPSELRATLLELPQIGGVEAKVNALMPIVRRFQTMVSPPWEPGDWPLGRPPWESGSRRYSPFDAVGSRDIVTGHRLTHAIPPFQPLEDIGLVQRGPGITACDFAQGLALRGVMGEPGDYRAILAGAGQERQLGVGDAIGTIGEATFIVQEITLNNVRIANQARPGDQCLVQFVEHEGITGISISY